jgi:hypothetical protein
MYPSLKYQSLDRAGQTDEELVLVTNSDPLPQASTGCCGTNYKGLKFTIGSVLVIFGLLLLVLSAIFLSARLVPAWSVLTMLASLGALVLGIFCFYTGYHASLRALNHSEALAQAVLFWVVFFILDCLIMLLAWLCAFGTYHGLINTGVNGCYDSCGPAVMLVIISSIALAPVLVVTPMALVVAIHSQKVLSQHRR